MTLLKVKRDGPRGWHLIDAGRFDPLRHELWQEPQEPAPQAKPEPKKPKARTK